MSSYRPVQTGNIGPLRLLPVASGGRLALLEIDIRITQPGDDGEVNGGFDNAGAEIDIGNDGSAKKGFFYFRATGIPQGVTINEAYLTLTASSNLGTVTVNVLIAASDEDNPAVPANKPDMEGRPRTAAQVAWSNLDAWVANTEYQSPSIVTVVQELVDRPGFAEDAILIFVEDNGSTVNSGRKTRSYNGDPTQAARLFVSWTEVAPPAATCDNILTGTYASLPASGTPGLLYLPSDGVSFYRDNGVTWDTWGSSFPCVAPDDSGFAWVNQGTATVSTTNGGVHLYAPNVAGVQMRIRKMSAPSTPYTVTALMVLQLIDALWTKAGILFRESASGKLATIEVLGTGTGIDVSKYTDENTFSAHYVNNYPASPFPAPELAWLRITDDGANRISYWSTDGRYWTQLHTVGRTDFLTADEIGWFVDSDNATYETRATLLSWEVS